MILDEDSEWAAKLDPALVDRLTRPLRRPGLVPHSLARRIKRRAELLLGRLTLLERLARKVRELEGSRVPIVYAQARNRPPETVVLTAPGASFVHTRERIVIERKREGSAHVVHARREPAPPPTLSPGLQPEASVVPASAKSPTADDERQASPRTLPDLVSLVTSHEAVPSVEHLAPRRSRVGAPLAPKEVLSSHGQLEFVALPEALPVPVTSPVPSAATTVVGTRIPTVLFAAVPLREDRPSVEQQRSTGPVVVRVSPAANGAARALVQSSELVTTVSNAPPHRRSSLLAAAPVVPERTRRDAAPQLVHTSSTAGLTSRLATASAMQNARGLLPLSSKAETAERTSATLAPQRMDLVGTIGPGSSTAPEPRAARTTPPPPLDLRSLADQVERVLARRAIEERDHKGWT